MLYKSIPITKIFWLVIETRYKIYQVKFRFLNKRIEDYKRNKDKI